MNIVIECQPSDDQCTLGEMFVDGVHECYTLEPPVRPAGVKVPGKTAIPRNIPYDIILYSSPKHGYIVPLLRDVPGFDFVEIHPGNRSFDTKACILVGMGKSKDLITQSDAAFQHLLGKIQAALWSRQPVMLRIEAVAVEPEQMSLPLASSEGQP